MVADSQYRGTEQTACKKLDFSLGKGNSQPAQAEPAAEVLGRPEVEQIVAVGDEELTHDMHEHRGEQMKR